MATYFAPDWVDAQPELTSTIDISTGNSTFNTKKLTDWFPYYDGHDGISAGVNEHLVNLERGYAPFGVMFRGTQSTPRADIANYHWKIFDTDGTTVLREYDSFNASYIYETAGSYNAELTVTESAGVLSERHQSISFVAPNIINHSDNGLDIFGVGHSFRIIGKSANNGVYTVATSSAGQLTLVEQTIATEASTSFTELVSLEAATKSVSTKTVSVWARDKATYYVDSVIGDDNFDGLSQTVDGGGVGPWKSMTRVQCAMRGISATGTPSGEWVIDDITGSNEVATYRDYSAGSFVTYRDSNNNTEYLLTSPDGTPNPPKNVTVHGDWNSSAGTIFNPGDQVLFNRGQVFNGQTARYKTRSYTAAVSNRTYNYTIIEEDPLPSYGNVGLHFGAYGTGDKPIIQATGAAQGAFFKQGTTFHFSMSDLVFNMQSDSRGLKNGLNRTVFMVISGHQNTICNNISVTKMEQGIVQSGSSECDGLYLHNYDSSISSVTQLFTSANHHNVAVVDSSFDLSSNHHLYTDLSNSLIYNSIFNRPAFGRTAFRMTGNTYTSPNINNWISDNQMLGWKDPRTYDNFGRAFGDGQSYNYSLINLSQNTVKTGTDTLGIDYTVFTRNTVAGYEGGMTVGACKDVDISNNSFSSLADIPYSLHLNSGLARRPLVRVNIENNSFTYATTFSAVNKATGFFRLDMNPKQVDANYPEHIGIIIKDNHLSSAQNETTLFKVLGMGNADDSLRSITEAEADIQSMIAFSGNTFDAYNMNTAMILIANYHLYTFTLSTLPYVSGIADTTTIGDDPARAYTKDSAFYTTLMGDTVINQV